MMVKSASASFLVVPQAEALLQILAVALDAPALMNDTDQLVDRRLLGRPGQDRLAQARLDVAFRPLDPWLSLRTQACLARALMLGLKRWRAPTHHA